MSDIVQVSCIIPAYNAEKYFRQALDSILAQTGVPFEVIVVDDGSTDNTAVIAATYGDRIQLVRQSNSGLAASRNRGVTLARGEFVVFMDADDLCPANRFSIQLRAFTADPDLGICAAHVQNFKGDMLPEGPPIAGYNIDMMLRRSLFDRLGLLKTDFFHAANLDWMLRARQAKVKEFLLPDVVVYRRLHGENMSLTGSNQSLREHLRILHASIKQSKQKPDTGPDQQN